jgi:hypothetical protein
VTEFERQVLCDLADLKADMRWLVGAHGKVQELEERVEKHEAYLQRFTGVATALAGLITLFHLAIDVLRLKH